jgi:hypothetical protein
MPMSLANLLRNTDVSHNTTTQNTFQEAFEIEKTHTIEMSPQATIRRTRLTQELRYCQPFWKD